jgi:hypothetical protein
MKYLTTPVLVIVAIVLAFLLLQQCRKDAPAIPPELEATSDSLRETRVAFDSLVSSNDRLTDSVSDLADALRRRTVPARTVVVTAGVTADSAATLAELAETARDSATLWETAYRARTVQVDSLSSVVASLDTAAVNDMIALITVRRSLSETTARLTVAEGLANDLRNAAEKKGRWEWVKRIGFSAGYGVQASPDGRFSHGLQVTLGVKVYP